jgi:signal transduction histidine kinase
VYISEGSVAGVVESIKAVAEGSLVLYLRYSQEDHGNPLLPLDVADLVAKASPVPVYVALDRYIGLGAVGGVVRRPREAGTRAAEMALRILTGTRARDIPIEATRVVPVFDARAMQRWGIGESRLPPGSIVSFRRPSLWRDYRREVLVVLGGLLVQSLLIVGLLYQRRARRQAEIESRRNLGLAADANRRVMMTALTGSIAHEISQPLGSILHNAQAAEMLVSSKRATPEVLREILSDIRTEDVRATQIIERHRTMLRKHQINKMRIDIQAVVHESLALVAHDVRARQIALEVHPLPAPCFVAGDQVLLQQVLVNLVLNAMDAMVDTLPERRRITVQYAVRPDRVEVSVRDAGTGLPAQVDGGLFEPFVTTKTSGIGIGLTIARTIVEAHDGRIEAVNNPEGGATFRVMLPCDDLTKAIRS